MASYEIEIGRTAEKQLKNLSERDQLRVVRAVLALAEEPYPRGTRKLSGYDDVFRIRVGRFRVLADGTGQARPRATDRHPRWKAPHRVSRI